MGISEGCRSDAALAYFYLLPVAEQMKNQVFKVTSNPLTYISERSYPIVSLFH